MTVSRHSRAMRTTRKPAIRARKRVYWSPERFLGEVYLANPDIQVIKLDYRRAQFGIVKFSYKIAGSTDLVEIHESPYNLDWWTNWFAKERNESKESA